MSPHVCLGRHWWHVEVVKDILFDLLVLPILHYSQLLVEVCSYFIMHYSSSGARIQVNALLYVSVQYSVDLDLEVELGWVKWNEYGCRISMYYDISIGWLVLLFSRGSADDMTSAVGCLLVLVLLLLLLYIHLKLSLALWSHPVWFNASSCLPCLHTRILPKRQIMVALETICTQTMLTKGQKKHTALFAMLTIRTLLYIQSYRSICSCFECGVFYW